MILSSIESGSSSAPPSDPFEEIIQLRFRKASSTLASFLTFLLNDFKSFNPLFKVLFIFPSQYLFAIGLSVVFSLTRWCWQIPAGRLRPRGTQDTASIHNHTCTGLSPAMVQLSRRIPLQLCIHIAVLQPRCCRNNNGLGCSPFARHYLGNH